MIRRLVRFEGGPFVQIALWWSLSAAALHLAFPAILPQPPRLERGSAGRSYPVR